METTFTKQIATFIQNSEVELENWVIILPSERAKQYIRKSLFEVYEKPIFAPKMLTIHQWVKQLTPQTILDRVRLVLALYEVHTLRKGKSSEVFDEFLQWSSILLADFDEIDRYLLDSKQLFRNLRDIKEIENWSFAAENLSEAQKKFMEFWDTLPMYYQQLNEKLEKENALYMGKAYRQVQEQINLVFTENKNAHFLFAGFNALSPAEKSIMKQLIRMGRGHVLIDADEYYLLDKSHEAGTFLRDIMQELELTKLPNLSSSLKNEAKMIEVISCAQTTGQAKAIGTILESLTQEELNKTLLLLADESLIVPMLNNLPKSIGVANITLGLPLRNSSLKTWVELLFRIQEGFIKFSRVSAYYKDVFQVLNHPFIVGILNEEEKNEVYKLENEIRQKNKIFQQVSAIRIPEKLKPIFNSIYEPWKNDWKKALTLIRQLNHSIHPMLSEKEAFEKAVLEGFDAALNDFQNCVEESFPEMSLRSFKVLFNQQWTKDSIAYYGNPIEGLQIMGLLETRLLDFENILVLGLNEGKMPPTNPIQTMIPMDLRRFFQLPTNREKQGLFAHHFYRLLHHCKRMHITYANSNEGIVTNEASRYLMQLELELSRLNPAIHFTKRDYTLSSDHSRATQIVVEKTDAVIERMEELFASGTSASAIKTFLACPLDFYYKYVLRFGEEKKVEEEVESSTFGTFIHETLEELYAPFSKRNEKGDLNAKTPPVLHVEDLDKMLNNFELIMRQKFSTHFNNDPNAFEKGKNFLSFSMALELTKRFLEKERKFILENGNKAYRIEGLEQEFIHDMNLNVYGKNLQVKLKGFADRIDSIDDSIRIIDYKTGKVNNDDVGKKLSRFTGSQVDALVKLSKESSHFFQLMTYMYLYYQRYNVIPSESAIVSFVNLNESPFVLNAGDGKVSNKEIIELFPLVFSHLLEEIFDRSTPFTHKTSSYVSYCRYC